MKILNYEEVVGEDISILDTFINSENQIVTFIEHVCTSKTYLLNLDTNVFGIINGVAFNSGMKISSYFLVSDIALPVLIDGKIISFEERCNL